MNEPQPVRPPSAAEVLGSAPRERRPSRSRKRSSRRRRRTGRTIALTLGLSTVFVIGSAAWIGWTALQAKADLDGARDDIAAVRASWSAGEGGTATQRLAAVQVAARSAHDATHDPVWWLWAHVPVVGDPFETVRGMTEAVDALAAEALPSLESVADVAEPGRMVTRGSTVDVARLSDAAGALGSASAVIDARIAQVEGLPASWVPQVATARGELLDQLTSVGDTARVAAVAAEVVPPMLGADGERRYFLGFQNLSETRGTGGLLDAYLTLVADNGTLRVDRVGSNANLPPLPAQIPGIDPDYAERYGPQGATSLWVNSNLSPDFPEVSRAWAAMWEGGTRQRIDGTIAMDPVALKGILEVTGPVDVPGIGAVDAAGIETLVYDTQYRLGKDVADRKQTMLRVGTSVVDALIQGRGDKGRLLATLVASARSGNIQLWSVQDAEQQAILDGGIGGAVPTDDRPFVRPVFVNAAGTKLDAYLQTKLAYTVDTCSTTVRRSTVTLTVKNAAPARGLPEYVVTRGDLPVGAYVPGQNRVDAQLLLGRGTKVLSASLDGEPLGLAPAIGELPETFTLTESGKLLANSVQAGLPSYGLTLDLEPGAEQSLSLVVEEPSNGREAVVRAQPLVRPTEVVARQGSCA